MNTLTDEINKTRMKKVFDKMDDLESTYIDQADEQGMIL